MEKLAQQAIRVKPALMVVLVLKEAQAQQEKLVFKVPLADLVLRAQLAGLEKLGLLDLLAKLELLEAQDQMDPQEK